MLRKIVAAVKISMARFDTVCNAYHDQARTEGPVTSSADAKRMKPRADELGAVLCRPMELKSEVGNDPKGRAELFLR